MANIQKMQFEAKLNQEVAYLKQRREASEEIDWYESSSGKCTECGSGVSIEIHMMKEKATGVEWNDRRRTRCDC